MLKMGQIKFKGTAKDEVLNGQVSVVRSRQICFDSYDFF